MHTYQDIIDFWFAEIDHSQWWVKSTKFDAEISARFSDVHARAHRCELFSWRDAPVGALAEVIVLDQFSRNMFRDTPQSFAFDAMALALAQTAISKGQDMSLEPEMRSFLYMPFMHSESLLIHQQARSLFSGLAIASTQLFEQQHFDIIAKFGRYPHRNKILGRESTPEEHAFLETPGSTF